MTNLSLFLPIRHEVVVLAYSASIDPTLAPDQQTITQTVDREAITILVEVHVESERIDLLDATKISLAAAPEVQQCYYVTGDADFVLVITVPTMSAYEALTRRLSFENSNVKRFRTLVVMGRVKVGLTIPIPR
jgi:DNA-binding Lrp family transcriptional regulator